jgi:steroid delta-isomerase-like uncharacterized protein
MANTNKENVIAIHDAFSKNQFDKVLELCHENVEVQSHALGMTFKGKDGFLGYMQSFKSAFPDVSVHHNNMLVDGDKVAVEFTGRGTHTGTLQTPAGSIAATGKPIEIVVSEFMTWENGRLRTLHNYQDAGTLLRQIGAL